MQLHPRKIVVGLNYDSGVDPYPTSEPAADLGREVLGPVGFLRTLEVRLGIASNARMVSRLYGMLATLRELVEGQPVYAQSFATNSWATASTLLKLRDELRMSGWVGTQSAGAPRRLVDLAAIESRSAGRFDDGLPDRIARVSSALGATNCSDLQIIIEGRRADFCGLWANLLSVLEVVGARVDEGLPRWQLAAPGTDLRLWQDSLLAPADTGPVESLPFRGDGSLVVLTSSSDGTLADRVGVRLAEVSEPYFVLKSKDDRLLNLALAGHGAARFPESGNSNTHPVLGVLPLALRLLWEPLDAEALVAFLALPVSPIGSAVARHIRKNFLDSPGLVGPRWEQVREEALEKARDYSERSARESGAPSEKIAEAGNVGYRQAQESLTCYVECKRYSRSGAPTEAIVAHLGRIEAWALRRAAAQENGQELRALAIGASDLVDLLRRSGQSLIGAIELDALVERMDLQSPDSHAGDAGCFHFCNHPGAIRSAAENCLWWNFDRSWLSANTPFWTRAETQWLAANGAQLSAADIDLLREVESQMRPLLAATKRLVLCVPDKVAGALTKVHPLLDHLRAMSGADRAGSTWHNLTREPDAWLREVRPAALATVTGAPTIQLPPHGILQVGRPIVSSRPESHSSLQSLFFSPQQWALGRILKLESADISFSPMIMFLGTLLHSVVERMVRLDPDPSGWTKERIEQDLPGICLTTLLEEGAVLLAPGNEVGRRRWENQAHNLAHALWPGLRGLRPVSILPEEKVSGTLGSTELTGKIDLLVRGPGGVLVCDVKSMGRTKRIEELRTGMAMQLALYAHLVGDADNVAISYLIAEPPTWITQPPDLIDGAVGVRARTKNSDIVATVLRTLEWRQAQMSRGEVCVVTEALRPALKSTWPTGMAPLPETIYDNKYDYAVFSGGLTP